MSEIERERKRLQAKFDDPPHIKNPVRPKECETHGVENCQSCGGNGRPDPMAADGNVCGDCHWWIESKGSCNQVLRTNPSPDKSACRKFKPKEDQDEAKCGDCARFQKPCFRQAVGEGLETARRFPAKLLACFRKADTDADIPVTTRTGQTGEIAKTTADAEVIAQLQRELDEARAEVKKKDHRIEMLRDQKKMLMETRAEVAKQLTASQGEVDEYTKKIAELEEENGRLIDELEGKGTPVSDRKKMRAELAKAAMLRILGNPEFTKVLRGQRWDENNAAQLGLKHADDLIERLKK